MANQQTTEANPLDILNVFHGKNLAMKRMQASFHLISNLPCVWAQWKHAKAFHKKSILRVLADMFLLIWKYHAITVVYRSIEDFINEYFSERLHEKDHSVHDYTLEGETINIMWVASARYLSKIYKIDDKNSGWKFLTKHNFPTTLRLGFLEGIKESVNWLDATGKKVGSVYDLLSKHCQVFTKPADGCVGRGCGVLSLSSDGRSLLLNEQPIQERDLAARFDKNFIIEPIIRQKEETARFHPASLNTLRLITLRKPENGEIYLDRAIFRMGIGGAKTDNWCTGGVAVQVHNNGCLDKYGFYCDASKAPCEEHPDSHIQFKNEKLCNFQQAVDLVLEVHKVLKGIHGIGWDIAFTEQGIIIVEMNPFFSIFQAQCGGIRKKVYEYYLPLALKSKTQWASLLKKGIGITKT